MLHLRPHHTKTACREIGAQRTEGSQAHRSGWWWDGPWGGVANWDARICPKGSRDKRLHPGLPLVCEGSMLMGFRNGNPSKSGDTLNLLANIEAIGDWRRLVEMSLPEIQDSGHGASISGGQWGSGTGHRAGWQHWHRQCWGGVCVPVSGPWAAVRLSPSAQWANKGVPQELMVALQPLAPLDRRQCGVSRYCLLCGTCAEYRGG